VATCDAPARELECGRRHHWPALQTVAPGALGLRQFGELCLRSRPGAIRDVELPEKRQQGLPLEGRPGRNNRCNNDAAVAAHPGQSEKRYGGQALRDGRMRGGYPEIEKHYKTPIKALP